MESSQEISTTKNPSSARKDTGSQKLSVLEKVGYSLGDLAANLVFQTLVTYLAYFYTVIYHLDT
jgi:Na+/melibiose symporter-like transporter